MANGREGCPGMAGAVVPARVPGTVAVVLVSAARVVAPSFRSKDGTNNGAPGLSALWVEMGGLGNLAISAISSCRRTMS